MTGENKTTVFMCKRGNSPDPSRVKIQLEISRSTLAAYVEKSNEGGQSLSAKQIMENMLRNWVEGVAAG